MNIILPVHKHWIEKIFSGEKIYEFRNYIPKHLKPNDTIYFYETSKNGGVQKVVGECKVKSFRNLTYDGIYPMFGCYSFIEDYMEIMEKKPEEAQLFKECKENQLAEFKLGATLCFALSEKAMEDIKNGEYPKYDHYDKTSNEARKLGNLYMEKCDNWLSSIGFYDDGGESTWKYAWCLTDVKKYLTTLELKNFKKINGEFVVKPPQSYIYVKGE